MLQAIIILILIAFIYFRNEYLNSRFKWKEFLKRRASVPTVGRFHGTAQNYFCKYCGYPSDTILESETRTPGIICLECKDAINIVTVGPEYRNHRGGVGAVLEVYAANISDFHFIPSFRYGSSITKVIVFIQGLFNYIFQLIANRRIKVIHLHNASKGSFLRKSVFLLIGKLFGKKVILHVHGAKFNLFYNNASGLLKKYIKYIVESADVVICLSTSWKTFFESTFNIKKLEIINNVVQASTDPVQLFSEKQTINFLFLGYVGDRKGIFDLITIFNENKEKYNGKYTLSIGGNGEIERLKVAIKDNPAIKYEGWVKGDKKLSLLKACDVYVLPSYNEGLPISILEAMSYAKPIISTTVGGIPEIVIPGYNGWLFTPGDPTALNAILNEVAENTSQLAQYGNNSLELSKKYTPKAVFESLNILYNQLLHV